MYDLYPEWGPARHRQDPDEPTQRRPRYWAPVGDPRAYAGSADARDGDGDRPDDN
jgi:hypothetical protein